jgi:hypothetical protein
VWRAVADARDQLRRQLLEAQQRFDAAPDQPFSEAEIQALLIHAALRPCPLQPAAEDVDAAFHDLQYQAITSPWSDRWAMLGQEPPSIIGWHVRVADERVSTRFDSLTVDARRLDLPARRVPEGTTLVVEPLVWNIWTDYDELATRIPAAARVTTWHCDAHPHAAGWQMFESSVFGSAGFDFDDYVDEVDEELLRN